jgi:hypothetical protein
MHLKQNPAFYYLMGFILNLPFIIILLTILGDFEAGLQRLLDGGFLPVFIIWLLVTFLLLVYMVKSIELNEDHIVLHHMKIFKKIIPLKDVRFVRLGTVMVETGNGTHKGSFMAFHTIHDKKSDDDVANGKATIVTLNFKAKDKEKIYTYFEKHGLLKDRKRYKYK